MALQKIFVVSLGFDYKSPRVVEVIAEVTTARVSFGSEYPVDRYFKKTVPAGAGQLAQGVAFENVGFGLTREAAIRGLERSLLKEVEALEEAASRFRARAELVRSLRMHCDVTPDLEDP